jgi:spore germination cell wall hydrolase CwlJ-like protein
MAETLILSRPFDGVRRTIVRVRERVLLRVRVYPRAAIGIGALGFVAAVALGSASVIPNSTSVPSTQVAPPAPPPLILQQLAPEQALKVNAEIPLAGGPNPAAKPFALKGTNAAQSQALQCLASAVYYEAGNQDEDGARAVAQVVLNRVRHPAFPNSVCGVVYQGSTRPTGCQFTFTCDGSLAREPDAEGWRRASRIAEDALSGHVYAPVGWATHYHADYVVPTWAASMAKSAIVGAHIFYRWPGSWGKAAVFSEPYQGREPDAAALRTAALAAPHVTPSAHGGTLADAIKDIPGAEPLKLAPSMRGTKRIAVRFNITARKASEDAVHEDYTKKFEASDNLKWSLSPETVAPDQQPLGKAPAAAPSSSGLASAQH